MTPTRTPFQVVPTAGGWEIRQDGVALLTVQTKQVAIDEAIVQAELTKPSSVAVLDAAGRVEEEANLGDPLPQASPRRRRQPPAENGDEQQPAAEQQEQARQAS
ncbi:MAG: DUF2188 domain-containing protein [Streptosporangiales bacterium]|nr:DUF2188 domain-containing protein [Streptosporangiales bacterium]